MVFEQRCVFDASCDALWDLIVKVPEVALCIPGVSNVAPVEGNSFRGRMNLSIGPIRLGLEGTVTIQTQDRATWRSVMRAEAADRRVGGGMKADMSMELREVGNQQSELLISTNLTLLGKLGEFGQPVIRRKADSILQEFARNLQSRVSAGA